MGFAEFIADIKTQINNNSTVKEIKEKVKEYTSREMDIKVCMLGARGVGKTSVLTSIFYDGNSKDGFYDTKVRLFATPETSVQLTKQREKIQDVFRHRQNISAIGASSGISEFNLQLGMLSEDANINLIITDYPGEKIVADQTYVAERIKESQVVLVAIDTPYLMEEEGVYDEEKNQTKLVKDFLLNNIDSLQEKLVLLVPLKCEKYLDMKRLDMKERNNRSEELADRVEAKYKELIQELKGKNNVAVAITPIITMGGVVFERFEVNSEGGNGAHYKFYDGKTYDGRDAKYEALFCSQPIFYLLSFVTRQYKQKRESINIFGKFLQNFENVDVFFDEMMKINRLRMNGAYGYRVLLGEDLFFTKNS